MKEKTLSILFFTFLVVFLILNIFVKDIEISTSERRRLQKFPAMTISNVFDGSFMEDLDNYTVDQFVARKAFRTIKSYINYNVFQRLENNGIYVINDNIFKTEYTTNIKSINNFINKINNIGEYLNSNNKVYYSIIPDKNYYVNDSKYLNINYDLLYNKIKEIKYNYIELRDVLNINDYYKTDTHWKQENLGKVVERLGDHIGFHINSSYKENYYNNFYGVYYGQAALNLSPDKLVYLTNDTIENSVVYYYEDSKNNQVYPLNKLENIDKYDIFLGGASSYIEITNLNNNAGRELVIFRDSFGSSLTPLLIEAYSKITLIDTRYISSNIYLDMIEFNNQDVLFLYSTLIVNNSSTLKQ